MSKLNKSSITFSDVPSVASVESIPEGCASYAPDEDPTVRAGAPVGNRAINLARTSARESSEANEGQRHSLDMAIRSLGLDPSSESPSKAFAPWARAASLSEPPSYRQPSPPRLMSLLRVLRDQAAVFRLDQNCGPWTRLLVSALRALPLSPAYLGWSAACIPADC